MEQESNSSNQTSALKIYTERAIWAGTFIGGPLVAGYLISQNFKAFNEQEKVRKTWIYAIATTLVIFGVLLALPNIKIPNQLIPLIYTFLAYTLVQYYQGKNIKAHIDAGGLTFDWWRTLGIGIIGAIITILPVLGIAYATSGASEASITRKTYGVMKHEIAFDKDSISETDIDKIADGLIMTSFFDNAVTKYTYVTKNGNRFEISISCNKSIIKDTKALTLFAQLRNDMQGLFPEKKIVINLVVDSIDNVVKRFE